MTNRDAPMTPDTLSKSPMLGNGVEKHMILSEKER